MLCLVKLSCSGPMLPSPCSVQNRRVILMDGRCRSCCWVSAPTDQSSAGDTLPPRYQVQTNRIPDILHSMGWRGTWKLGEFFALRGGKRVNQLISELREAVAPARAVGLLIRQRPLAASDGKPPQSQHICYICDILLQSFTLNSYYWLNSLWSL